MHRARSQFGWIGLLCLVLALPSWAQRTELINGHEAVANEVLIKFRHATPQQVAHVHGMAAAVRSEKVGGTGVYRIRSAYKGVGRLLADLSQLPGVDYVEPNYLLYANDAIPNDPLFKDLWGIKRIGAPAAWDITTGSTDVTVGVVDTGVDYSHPDLDGNIWTAPTDFTVTVGDATITCAAGTHGFNAIRMRQRPCDPMDDNDHGTHVSGTIGAEGDNSLGVAGVNWTASIMGLKFLSRQGSGSTADAINAIEFAIQANLAGVANVRVLSNSWGGGLYSRSLLDTIRRAYDNNILFVASAGNYGKEMISGYPATYSSPNVVAVAATEENDLLASFSSFGQKTIHLGAPGVNILSTVLGGQYASMDGTSMAAPHVSGTAALVLSVCPSLDVDQVRAALLRTTEPLEDLKDKTITGGLLSASAAVAHCGEQTMGIPDFTVSVSPLLQSAPQGGSAGYTVTLTSYNNYSGEVALEASAEGGADISAILVPTTLTLEAGGTASATLTLAAAPSASERRTYRCLVFADDGMLLHNDRAFLEVTGGSAPPTAHDVAVSGVSATPSAAAPGDTVAVQVTVENYGTNAETADITVAESPDGDNLGWQSVTLAASGSANLTFSWNTTESTTDGTHTLFATATLTTPGVTDEQPANNARSTTVSIASLVLTATGYRVKGAHMVDLAWTGSRADWIDVYRNDARIDTVENSESYTDAVGGKGTMLYVYKVCDAGTTRCSNTANVLF